MLHDEVGFRTILTRGKQVLLNGKPTFLRGVCLHEEYAVNGGGRITSPEQDHQLLSRARELNCNFVRLAHYPHNEPMVRLADKMGLMVWSESPVYWTIDWTNQDTYRNAEAQRSDAIERDYNRAAVIIWSLANETPVSDARNRFNRKGLILPLRTSHVCVGFPRRSEPACPRRAASSGSRHLPVRSGCDRPAPHPGLFRRRRKRPAGYHGFRPIYPQMRVTS
jgi:Glycosyl hydrolases family 2, TIM barrel domain